MHLAAGKRPMQIQRIRTVTPHHSHRMPARHSADQHVFLQCIHFELPAKLPSRQWWYCTTCSCTRTCHDVVTKSLPPKWPIMCRVGHWTLLAHIITKWKAKRPTTINTVALILILININGIFALNITICWWFLLVAGLVHRQGHIGH